MELKPGYKQTEMGVIPEDWTVETLGELGQVIIGLTYKPEQVAEHGTLVLRSSNIQDCALKFEDNVYVHADIPSEIMAQPGDVLVCVRNGSRDLIGKTALLDERTNGMTFGAFMAVFRCPIGSLINYHFQSSALKQQVNAHLGATINQITNRSLRSFQVILPPTKRERDSIVEALQDIDDLIENATGLIAKKRNIKQAAMQELLTGKRRLPEFDGEWVVKRLGDEIRDLEAGVSVRSTTDKEQPSTGRYILKTSAVSQGQFSPIETKEIISCDISRAKTPIKAGDLIISRMNTPALVGECGYSHSDHPNLFLPDRLWRAAYRDPQAVSSRWLSYTLSTQQNRTRIKELATGTSGSMKNISKRPLLDLEIKWPSLDEQNAIAEVLSEMDDDIDSINAQLHKAQGIKRGMMQQLLTGKIRLR
jgi:type I restriction enzyme S subunit